MGYCLYKNRILYGEGAPGEPLDRLPEEGEVLYLFRREPLTGRDTFPVTAPALLAASLRPIAEALPHWPGVELTPEQAQRVRNGMAVPCASLPPGSEEKTRDKGLALLLDRGEALALAQRKDAPGGSCWAVLRGLWN